MESPMAGNLQLIEEVDASRARAIRQIKAQIEATVAFHVHICHLIIAEAHHVVHKDPFQVNHDVFLSELAHLSDTPKYHIDNLPTLTARAVRGSIIMFNAANASAADSGRQGAQLDLKAITDRFRKKHAELAVKNMEHLADLVLMSVRRLSEVSRERARKKKEQRQVKVSVGSGSKKTAFGGSTSTRSILGRRSSKATSMRRSQFVSGATNPSSSSGTSLHATEVSFDPELLDMELVGEDVHPLTAAFTAELYRYEALFEQRMSDYSEFQRVLMRELLEEVTRKVPLDAAEIAGNESSVTSVVLWNQSVASNRSKQLDYIDCFFASLGTVSFPNLARTRRDTAFPRRLRSPTLSSSDSSESSARSSEGSPQKYAKAEDYSIPISVCMQTMKTLKPHMDLILHSYMEIMTRNQEMFMHHTTSKICKECLNLRRIHPRLQQPGEFLDRMRRAQLDTEYLTRAYRDAMTSYATQLGLLVTAHARNFARTCKHMPDGMCPTCQAHVCRPPEGTRPISVKAATTIAKTELTDVLQRMEKAPKSVLTVRPPLPVASANLGKAQRRLTTVEIVRE